MKRTEEAPSVELPLLLLPLPEVGVVEAATAADEVKLLNSDVASLRTSEKVVPN
jgi:hypothetical protein